MANKRMFTKQIIDSDAFLDMPLSSQCLYFHLNMRADDDGFINNPKKIQRMIGASDDDLKILIAKRFVLTFQNGVIVIKHWRMHNTIRGDRYTPTQYQEELKSLVLKENNSYSDQELNQELPSGKVIDTEWSQSVAKRLPDGCQSGTADKGLDIGIDIDLDIEKRESKQEPHIDYKMVVDNFHFLCPRLPKVKKLDDNRRKTIKAWGNIQEILDTFTKAGKSDFLSGDNNRNWRATFDWIIKPGNRLKILEGAYDNRGKIQNHNVTAFNDYEQRNTDYDSLEKRLLGWEKEEET